MLINGNHKEAFATTTVVSVFDRSADGHSWTIHSQARNALRMALEESSCNLKLQFSHYASAFVAYRRSKRRMKARSTSAERDSFAHSKFAGRYERPRDNNERWGDKGRRKEGKRGGRGRES